MIAALDKLCRTAGIVGGERDDINRALGILNRRGISGGLWLASNGLTGNGMGTDLFVAVGAPADPVLATVRSTDRETGNHGAYALTAKGHGLLENKPFPGGYAHTTRYAVNVTGSGRGAPFVVKNTNPFGPISGVYAGDAEAPDAPHLDTRGYDENLDCQCPAHAAARAGGL